VTEGFCGGLPPKTFEYARIGVEGLMRVLLIEDDSATAQTIELMLKSEGFNVYTTDLGEEGVDLGKIYDYDLILLDLNLPDMSGIDVPCARARP
jgi:DNA-binding response OmpR family regulator